MEGVEFLDVLLVPSGLLILIIYHCQLTYRVHAFPTTTVIGINQINRQVWVQTMMKVSNYMSPSSSPSSKFACF